MKFFKILCSAAILCIFVLAALSCKTDESALSQGAGSLIGTPTEKGNTSDASSLTGK